MQVLKICRTPGPTGHQVLQPVKDIEFRTLCLCIISVVFMFILLPGPGMTELRIKCLLQFV